MEIKKYKYHAWVAGIDFFRHFQRYLQLWKNEGMKIFWEENSIGFFGLFRRKYSVWGEKEDVNKIIDRVNQWELV